MGGRTDTNADAIGVSREGVPTALLSIPLRYMHTPVEVIDLEDLEGVARLLAAMCWKEGKTVADMGFVAAALCGVRGFRSGGCCTGYHLKEISRMRRKPAWMHWGISWPIKRGGNPHRCG